MRFLIAHAAWMQGRKNTLSRVLASLGPTVSRENVTVLESTRREPSYVWARRLWAEAARTPYEYAVCLNDDVFLCEGFERHVRAAACAAPTEIISLHCQAPVAAEIAKSGVRWARSYWLTGPAYVLPPGAPATLLEFWDSLPFELATRLNEDNVAIHWAWSQQRPILQTLPALALHDVCAPSSLGYDAHPFREPSVPFSRWPIPEEWPEPGPTVAYAENPWATAASLMHFRTWLQDGLPICTACLGNVSLLKGQVQLCHECAKKVALALLGRVL